MASKKAKSQPSPETSMLRVLAVHHCVTERLDDWASEPKWSTVAIRMMKTIDMLKRGKVAEAEMALDSLFRSVIHESAGVREYGLRQKGGAPRLFVLHRIKSFFFVAAGLEEGSTGCPEVENAKERGRQLSKLAPLPSVDALKRVLGREYDIWLIPDQGTRETR